MWDRTCICYACSMKIPGNEENTGQRDTMLVPKDTYINRMCHGDNNSLESS